MVAQSFSVGEILAEALINEKSFQPAVPFAKLRNLISTKLFFSACRKHGYQFRIYLLPV